MKLLMVQAFPNDDLERIWISVGIVMVLLAWSLVSFEAGGKISAYMLATRARSIGVFLLLVTILHSGDGASSIGIPLLPDLDLPASWSGARWVVFLIALGLAPLGYLMLNTYGGRAKEMEIPFVATFPVAMVIIIAVLSVIELPFPNDRFTDASAPIAGSTIRGWSILFAVTVGAYFVGKVIHRAMPGRFRRVLLVLFAASYPIIIMVIQRNPVLIWSDILDLSPGAPLGALLVAAIVGGGIVYWLAAPNTGEGVENRRGVAGSCGNWGVSDSTGVPVANAGHGVCIDRDSCAIVWRHQIRSKKDGPDMDNRCGTGGGGLCAW